MESLYHETITKSASETAWNTLQGYEVMHMVRKGQMRSVEKGDIMGPIAFISSLF
jgi:transposase, IS6 family